MFSNRLINSNHIVFTGFSVFSFSPLIKKNLGG